VALLLTAVKQKLALICSVMSELAGHDDAWLATGATMLKNRTMLRRKMLARVDPPPTRNTIAREKAAASDATVACLSSALTTPSTPTKPASTPCRFGSPLMPRGGARCSQRNTNNTAAQAASKTARKRLQHGL
jgi:hypothetical protein